MRPPQLLSPAKTFVVNAARLLCGCFSRSGNSTPSSPPNPPPMSAADDELPYEHYSDAVQQLLSLLPPNCALFKVDEVKVFGDVPLEAGGYADLWEATLCGRDVIQKTYRRYETSDVESIFRVRNNGSSGDVWFTFLFQRYCREVSVCSQLSHPNVVPFVGITSTPSCPFSLVFDTAGHLGLREYLKKNPQADKLSLVRRLPFSIRLQSY